MRGPRAAANVTARVAHHEKQEEMTWLSVSPSTASAAPAGRRSAPRYEADADIEWVAINDVADPALLAQLLKHDTVYGPFRGAVEASEDALIVDGVEIAAPPRLDPSELPWDELDVDVVIESTGRFRKRADAEKHLAAGAAQGDHLGAGEGSRRDRRARRELRRGVRPRGHRIISNASCTTNCLAPVAKVLHEASASATAR